MSDEKLVKQARVLIDYADPEVIARQNIPPNAGCVIDGTFYDVRNLVHLASSQADQIEQLVATNEAARADAKEAEAYAEELEVMNKNQEAMIRQADDRGDAWRFRADIAEVKLAKAEAALKKAVGFLAEADRRIIWEGLGFGNDFADSVDAFLAKQGEQP
jgi:hypothetical protein